MGSSLKVCGESLYIILYDRFSENQHYSHMHAYWEKKKLMRQNLKIINFVKLCMLQENIPITAILDYIDLLYPCVVSSCK